MSERSYTKIKRHFTKWSSTLKQFIGNLPTNCLSVFDHFVGLALKGVKVMEIQNFTLILISLLEESQGFQPKLDKKFPDDSPISILFSKYPDFKRSRIMSLPSKQNQHMRERILPWTYNWGGLTPLLSIVLFLMYLFIRLDVSAYILMIYKWSKIRARYAFWLNINELQPWKFIGKNCNPIFFWFCMIFLVPLVSQCMK